MSVITRIIRDWVASDQHGKNDLPTISNKDIQVWCKNGNHKIHRDHDLPAIIRANGDQLWYQNGKLHRDHDLPAIILANGRQYWYQNGELHRDNHAFCAII